ncbi:MAG: hypothetical protein HKN63_05050 [Rhodobacteraceae bacterium]|nr:hypothetical protein [Paracoccaceae bacterium]
MNKVQNPQSRLSDDPASQAELRLLGPFQLRVGGRTAELKARKARALLAYLAVRAGQDVSRETLMGLLWPDRASAQARASLRQTLSSVRKALGPSAATVLHAGNDTVRLDGGGIWLDRTLIAADTAGLTLEQRSTIAEHCRGAFLEGFALDEPEFDRWLAAERAAVRAETSALLAGLAAAYEQNRDLDAALRYGTRLLSLDPLQEHVHRSLMRCYAEQRRFDAALGQYEQCRRELQEQLGVDPEPQTQALVQSIKAQRRKPGPPPAPQASPKPSEPGAAQKPSVAILPFANLSGDPDQDLLGDGISRDIITELSRFRTLSVVAQHSSFALRDESADIRDIGARLGAQYVVEGSVRRAGDAIRITAQLVEAETGHSLWAQRYDRTIGDIFAVQDDVSRSIVAVLPGRVQVDVAERALRKPPSDMRAYEHMLKGKHLRDGLNAVDNARARAELRQALKLDPGYARAYMYLADTYVVDLWLGLADDGASAMSLDLARKGAALDNRDVYIQDQIGFALLCEGLWDEAERQFTRTLDRIVNEAESMAWCGYAFLLLGHPDRARTIVAEARALDPLHAPALDWVEGQVQFFAGAYESAVQALIGEALLNSLGHAFLVSAYACLGKPEEAAAALQRFIEVRQGEFAARGKIPGAATVQDLAGGYRGMWRRQEDWARLAAGLRHAGLPEG